MMMTMTKMFTAVLFVAIWLHSATTRASIHGNSVNNTAKSSVRLALWYEGVSLNNKIMTDTRKGSEPPEVLRHPEELTRVIEKYLLAQ